MPTYQVTCSNCQQEKWPTLPERPEEYLCALCTAVSPEQRVKRREAYQRGRLTLKSRQSPPDARTGAISDLHPECVPCDECRAKIRAQRAR